MQRINKLVYVTNLHPETTDEDLRAHLAEVGRIRWLEKGTHHAFVEFYTKEEGDEVVQELNGVPLFGYALRIQFGHERAVYSEHCVRIRNLPRHADADTILDFLLPAGEVVEVRHVSETEARVEFFYHEDAEYVVRNFDGDVLMDRPIRFVREAEAYLQDPKVSSSFEMELEEQSGSREPEASF